MSNHRSSRAGAVTGGVPETGGSRSSAVDGNVILVFDAAAANFRILDKGGAQLFAHRGDAFARARVVAELVCDDPRLTALRAFLPEIAHLHDRKSVPSLLLIGPDA